LNGHIEETISGQKVVKAYGQEEKVTEVFSERNKIYKDAAVRADILSSVMGPLMNMMNNTTYALIALIGGVMIVRGYTTVGIVVTFVNYSRQFSRPINQIASLYNTIQGAIAGAERVFEIIDYPPEIISEPGAEKPEHIEGQVSFEAVDFSYAPGSKVLKGVTFKAQEGESIALVGPTGAGKTTIINLLTRFYDIDSGHIKIDGKPIKAYDVQTLRSKIGIVLQDTYLFSDTVMENIRYGRLDATDEEVIEAAKLASAHQFIHRLPNGYETVLSSEGTNISQGQRQLIAIARTILASPDILILDEATSSVDTRTEQHIQEGLLNLMQGRTSFVIAHRLSTIRRADQILVIRDGEVFERGSHDTLLSVDGFYSELYNAQFRKKVS
jgi:ATP-binding cassette subfamily B protein